jgi:hypothetical protein
MSSKSMKGKGPAVPHLASKPGGWQGEIWDLRNDADEAFVNLETPGNGGTGVMAVQEWTTPLAANATYVLGATSATTVAKTVSTFTHATLPHARSIDVACTVTGVGAGSVVVHGTDIDGLAKSESYTVPAATATVNGNGAFATITSVVLPPTTAGMSALSITVGSGAKLGLCSKVKVRNGTPAIWVELESGVAVGGAGVVATATNQTTIATNNTESAHTHVISSATPIITCASSYKQQAHTLKAPGGNYHAQFAAGAAIDHAISGAEQLIICTPPRTVQIARGGAGAATVYTVTGTDYAGNVLIETINSNGAFTVQGTKAFATITHFASNVDPTVTTDLQVGNGFSLCCTPSSIDSLGEDGVVAVIVSSDLTTGTVVPTTVPNAAHTYTVKFRVLPTATQAAHDHGAATAAGSAHTHVQVTHNHTQDPHSHGGTTPGTVTAPAVGLPYGCYIPTNAPNASRNYALVFERDLT